MYNGFQDDDLTVGLLFNMVVSMPSGHAFVY